MAADSSNSTSPLLSAATDCSHVQAYEFAVNLPSNADGRHTAKCLMTTLTSADSCHLNHSMPITDALTEYSTLSLSNRELPDGT